MNLRDIYGNLIKCSVCEKVIQHDEAVVQDINDLCHKKCFDEAVKHFKEWKSIQNKDE